MHPARKATLLLVLVPAIAACSGASKTDYFDPGPDSGGAPPSVAGTAAVDGADASVGKGRGGAPGTLRAPRKSPKSLPRTRRSRSVDSLFALGYARP